MERRILFMIVILFLMWSASQACFSTSFNKTVYVKTGTDYYNECECTKPGYDTRNLQWLDINNKQIGQKRPGTDTRVFTIVNESCCVNLHIPYMTKGISGAYKCVTNFEGQDYEQLHYLVAYDPITINPPEKQHLLLGDKSLIRCEVHAEPNANPIVTWYKEKDGNLIKITPSDKYIYAPEGLYVNNVSSDDRGKYSCTALDMESTDGVDKDIDVEIMTFPAITGINADPGTTLIVGDRLRLECMADGVPHPEYIWTKIDGEPINTTRWDQRFNTILIDNTIPEDEGTYECKAQSLAGVVTKNVSIKVLVPPRILSFPNIVTQEGQTIEFVCEAVARPQPNVSILFVGDARDINEIYNDEVIPNFSFKKVHRSHMGVYVCNASNEVDYATEFMNLTVQYGPHFDEVAEDVWGWEGKVVNLSCICDSNPPSVVNWRYQGNEILKTDQIEINKNILTPINANGDAFITVNVSSSPLPYGLYECKATNPLGEDTKTIHFKEGHAPSAIVGALIFYIDQTSVTFTIQGPDPFEGPAITGFTAEYDKAENYNVTHIHLNRTWSLYRPFTIEKLEPNTTYQIRFAAINDVNNGPWSEMLEFQTLEPLIPNMPEWDSISDFVNITTMDQEVRWTSTEGNGAPVQFYTVVYCTDNENPCVEVKVAANEQLKLNNNIMEFNTTYFINLIAHNSVGDSLAANLTVLMLAEELPPPSSLSAGALIGISVVVVFVCLLLLDLLLLMWRRQGIIASCCVKKKKSKADENLHTRDKKGLLNDNREPEDTLRRPDNGHKEFEYNKTTGIITGRHSAV